MGREYGDSFPALGLPSHYLGRINKMGTTDVDQVHCPHCGELVPIRINIDCASKRCDVDVYVEIDDRGERLLEDGA